MPNVPLPTRKAAERRKLRWRPGCNAPTKQVKKVDVPHRELRGGNQIGLKQTFTAERDRSLPG